VAKQKISKDDVADTKARMSTTTKMEDIADVDYVIEAVPVWLQTSFHGQNSRCQEIPELKFKIFSQLAKTCKPTAILGSNTSSISITRIAAATTEDPNDLAGPSRVIGMHFMNPVPVLKGVEIITGLQTSQSTVDSAIDLCTRMGKVISQSTDSPGFLANRILMPYINEAIICLETGIGEKQDIDAIMKNGTNVPMGPLQLADFIGLDTCLAIMKILYHETGDSKYRPAVLLKKMVDAGWLGKKAGRGFYEY
jgi:3-hydroxybutyryl-CoA dehydrogenase